MLKVFCDLEDDFWAFILLIFSSVLASDRLTFKSRARNVSREDNSDVMGDNCAVMKLRSYKKSQDGNVSPSQLESKLFCNTACDWSELASQLY